MVPCIFNHSNKNTQVDARINHKNLLLSHTDTAQHSFVSSNLIHNSYINYIKLIYTNLIHNSYINYIKLIYTNLIHNSYINYIKLIFTNLIHNSYINYIKLNAFTCFGRHPPILRRSMSLIVHLCSLWYSYSLQVAVLCTC